MIDVKKYMFRPIRILEEPQGLGASPQDAIITKIGTENRGPETLLEVEYYYLNIKNIFLFDRDTIKENDLISTTKFKRNFPKKWLHYMVINVFEGGYDPQTMTTDQTEKLINTLTDEETLEKFNVRQYF